VLVSDRSGRILASTVDAGHAVGQVIPRGGSSGDVDLVEERSEIDGVRRMYADVVADAGPWVVSVGLPMSVAMSKAMSLSARSSAVLALGLAGWLTVVIVLSRRLTDAVGHLDATAQRIAKGDFSPMTHRPMLSEEFNELQTAFDAMLQRFNETRGALDAQMGEERRIRQELESLQGQVIRQERLAAVGQLVSGVAHEINNPLQAILGFAELLQNAIRRARVGENRSAAHSEGKRPRLRDHPQPRAVRAPAAGLRRNRQAQGRHHLGGGTASASVAVGGYRAAHRRPLGTTGHGRGHRAPAGRAELRRQCGAGDRHRRGVSRDASPCEPTIATTT
jgi:signal transduction histidine kinase